MIIRELERDEVGDIWTIDRAEVTENVYYHERGRLVLKPEHYDMQGWPPGEPEAYGPILLDCFDRGGTFYGAFQDGKQPAVSVSLARQLMTSSTASGGGISNDWHALHTQRLWRPSS